jgi:GNAT superfamily N-acetyltransferase
MEAACVRNLIEPRIISLPEYVEHFKGSLSAISAFYAKKSASDKYGVLFGAFLEGRPCGALSAGIGEDGGHYIFRVETAEPYRRRGASKALLDFALPRLKSSGLDAVKTVVALSLPSYAVVESMLKKKGFEEVKTLTTVMNYYTDDSVADFYDFTRARGDKLAARLTARGYAAKSFAESGESGVRALEDEMGVSFPASLSPFRNSERILKDFSFIVFKCGRPVAYCVMTDFEGAPGVTAVSSRACSAGAGRTGAAMWALLRCLEESMLYGRFVKTLFTFESDNLEMTNLKDGPPTRFKGSQTSVSRVYRLRLRCFKERPQDA